MHCCHFLKGLSRLKDSDKIASKERITFIKFFIDIEKSELICKNLLKVALFASPLENLCEITIGSKDFSIDRFEG